jgi:hypothetical protein
MTGRKPIKKRAVSKEMPRANYCHYWAWVENKFNKKKFGEILFRGHEIYEGANQYY